LLKKAKSATYEALNGWIVIVSFFLCVFICMFMYLILYYHIFFPKWAILYAFTLFFNCKLVLAWQCPVILCVIILYGLSYYLYYFLYYLLALL
jgi:hypothetical protein